MTTPESVSATAEADALFREFLRHCLAVAAEHFGLSIEGSPTYGWRLRTVGSRARRGDGGLVWLRVVSQEIAWERGPAWTGTVDAAPVAAVAKPRVLGVYEWVEQSWRIQRAEISTLMPGDPCATIPAPQQLTIPPPAWWNDLRAGLDRLAATPTARRHADQARVSTRLRDRFGSAVDAVDTTVAVWETVHADLHWANLMQPDCAVLDWELWGTGPAGLDAASLLCHSLLIPELTDQVGAVFADKLASRSGQISQLFVIARLLDRAEAGDYPDLIAPLRRRADEVIQTLAATDADGVD